MSKIINFFIIVWRIIRGYSCYYRTTERPIFSEDYPTFIASAKNTHYYNTHFRVWFSIGNKYSPNCPITKMLGYSVRRISIFTFLWHTGIDGLKRLANDVLDETRFEIKQGDIEGYQENKEHPVSRSRRITQIAELTVENLNTYGLEE